MSKRFLLAIPFVLSALVLSAAIVAGCGPGRGPTTDEPRPGTLGSRCARNADCNSRLCLGVGRCTTTCDVLDDCPDTWTCDAVAGAGLLCQCAMTSPEEICNGLDDECDGRIDNGATCPDGLTCEDGACLCPVSERCEGECVDRQTDVRHCGGCNQPCDAGEVCEAGACVVNCTAGTERCGTSCVTLATDPNHCGTCERSCGVGGRCDAGACTCAGGLSLCTSGCVDPSMDRMNCGGCGRACDADEVCRAGSCVCGPGRTACAGTCSDVMIDEANCGGCGRACGAGETCEAGTCVAPVVPIGRPCSDSSECVPEGGGLCATGFPGGYCTQECGACPTGSTCINVQFTTGPVPLCLTTCDTAIDCRPGYICDFNIFDGDYCYPDV